MHAARIMIFALASVLVTAHAQTPRDAPAPASSDRSATTAPPDPSAAAPAAATAPAASDAPAAIPPAALPVPIVPRPAASLPVPLPPAAAAGAPSAGIILEPGLYRCELSRQVVVRRVAADGQSVVIHWNKRDFTLTAVLSRAGALRYDDIVSGLAWITIPGKSMLLDTKKGAQLANECKL